MSKNPKITLLGNNSGRNLGDAAILSSILEMLKNRVPEAEVLVPTLNPKFVDDHYGEQYNMKAVDVRPRTFSMRLLGIPTMAALAKSEIALICDGIIFGYKLFSPHNFLITLFFIVPWARLCGCKVVIFSCGIGPFPSKLSEKMARFVIDLCDLVIMREHDSEKLAKEIGVKTPIQVTGDAAFVNPVSDRSGAQKIADENNLDLSKPILGLNITPYVDSWLTKERKIGSKQDYLEQYAKSVSEAIEIIKKSGAEEPQRVVYSCSPMDEQFSRTFAEKIGGVVIDNTRYLSHDIMALMRETGLLIGMRFHSCVLASGSGTPIIGLVYAPKVRGYMRQLDCEEYSVELKEIWNEDFPEILARGWQERDKLKEKQQKVVAELKKGALDAADQLKDKYFS